MHQHVLFTPARPQTSVVTPAPATMKTKGTNLTHHIPKETPRVHSFTPVTTFHKTPQMSFRSPKRGRGGALHVWIAWNIYYQEKIKKEHANCISLHQEVTPEYPVTSLPDVVLHKEPFTHQNPDSPCRQAVHGSNNRTDVGKTVENVKQFQCHPAHPDMPSASSRLSHTVKRVSFDWEKQPPKTDEKEHRHQRLEASPLMDKTWKLRETPVVVAGHCWDRKRQCESSSFSKVKRMKQEISNNRSESARILHTHLSSHNVPVQHVTGEVSAFYSKSRCTTVQHRTPMKPAAEMYSHQTALWGIQKKTDLPSRQNLQRDNTLNTCNAIRIPCVAQRDTEALTGIPTLPLYFSPGLREHERSCIRQRMFLQSHVHNSYLLYCQHPLPHHGFITPSYSGL
ncbi:uncharacterized protein LOC115431836 [Sphaeramia orbicularis]|uniref:uncharacterized protein LOC115431836 n=1 Tax=Sphaeramia orbicularis TaxID=375764 RepID=UPI00117DA9E8|nr:uncharacterized protein LOC115431836 [Sphaeramia orbicularis]